MVKKYNPVVIGRFQPFHKGHMAIIGYIHKNRDIYSDDLTIVIGSANESRTFKNPWDSSTRSLWIKNGITKNYKNFNVSIKLLNDAPGDDDMWLGDLYGMLPDNYRIVGHYKDESSYYLNMFPAFRVDNIEMEGTLNGVDIRKKVFHDEKIPGNINCIDPYIHSNFVSSITRGTLLKDVQEEIEYYRNCEEEARNYPRQFVTCDALCTQLNHVLLVNRKHAPGKGKWALPGGFVDPTKGDSFENVLHEITEETGLATFHTLRKAYTGIERRFDAPGRSERGYCLTTVFKFELPPMNGQLYPVEGSDDAAEAKWVHRDDLGSYEFFEDHGYILRKML